MLVKPASTHPSIHHQSITHEGDIILDNNETFTIEGSNFTIAGDVIVNDNARLMIRNTNFTIAVIVHDGISHAYLFSIRNKAMVSITNSKINLGLGGIILENSSIIHINNSTVSRYKDASRLTSNQLDIRHNSTAYIQNSEIECDVYPTHNSIVYIEDSWIRYLHPGVYSTEGNITAQIRNSDIDGLRADYSNVHIWNSTIGSITCKDSNICVEDAKIQSSLSASGNSMVVLIHTYIRDRGISARDSSVVLVTLDFLPFVVLVPYQWVPWIWLGIVIAIIASVGLVIHMIGKRRIRRGLEKEIGRPPLNY
jgi:hypothetical protein